MTPKHLAQWPLILMAVAAAFGIPADTVQDGNTTSTAWQPLDIRLEAESDHPWWTFPIRATFRHQGSGTEIDLEGFWDGGRDWVIRFAPNRAGDWTYSTSSTDAGLNGRSGQLKVAAATSDQIEANPNYRGHLAISDNGRFFRYADGTPFLLLADTLWAGNTARCGLGDNEDGPFYRYLADRRAKGFTAILMQYFHGYGDYPDSPGHRNESGKPFFDPPAERLNPKHFQQLDLRMRAMWERGFVTAIPTTWWGKTRRCSFTIEDARRISAYCAVRYGAYNTLWALSGEYQYCLKDCGWTAAQISSLGTVVQRHNPYRRPLSIHPSGRTDWPAPHNCQSSRPFHQADWLDHHWLQTGQSADRMYNIVTRAAENRALEPARPVFCSEAYYEHAGDAEGGYHARWQAWVAFLNGCAGYGYGAQGIWQFYDPSDAGGQPGKNTSRTVPWQQALAFEGSAKIAHVASLLRRYEWWRLEPARLALRINGAPCPEPTATDITPAHCGVIGQEAFILYIPRDNHSKTLELSELKGQAYHGEWFNPRTGHWSDMASPPHGVEAWTLSARPAPAKEDWVLVLERR